MPESTSTPNYIVSDACISFAEALISCRSAVISAEEAKCFGQDLFTWFQNQGAVTAANAPLAKRSVEFGILALRQSSVLSAADIVGLIQDTYSHYAS
ncbi:MAG TPA: hypothetical protein VFB27_00475 [Opitutaceae bacterium]|nr:hypothetical protein [Opitutaceae bacterium]